jgi:hypothetical protein
MYNKISSFHAEVHMKGFVNVKSVLLALHFLHITINIIKLL